MHNYTQLLDEVFCDIRSNEGRGRGYQPKPKAEADNAYRDLNYSGYHKKPHPIIVLLYIERKKKMVTTVSGTDNLFLNV